MLHYILFHDSHIIIIYQTLLHHQDTVQPKEDWSLKAAKKLKSCMCCDPGEGDEDDEDEGSVDGGNGKEGAKAKDEVDMAMPGAFATNSGGRSKYVDGKAAFAFDPTKFSK